MRFRLLMLDVLLHLASSPFRVPRRHLRPDVLHWIARRCGRRQ